VNFVSFTQKTCRLRKRDCKSNKIMVRFPKKERRHSNEENVSVNY